MVTLYLEKCSSEMKAKIIDRIDHLSIWDCNFNGLDPVIVDSDYTWIEGMDEYQGCILLRHIYDILSPPYSPAY